MLKELFQYYWNLIIREKNTLKEVLRRDRWAPINLIGYGFLLLFVWGFLILSTESLVYSLIALPFLPILHFVGAFLGHWMLYVPLYLHVPERSSKKWSHILPTVMVEQMIIALLSIPFSIMLEQSGGLNSALRYALLAVNLLISTGLGILQIGFYATWYRETASVPIWKGVLFYFEATLIFTLPIFALVYLAARC